MRNGDEAAGQEIVRPARIALPEAAKERISEARARDIAQFSRCQPWPVSI